MLDLEALAEERGYRTSLDPAAAQTPRAERAPLVRIPGRRGFVSVHGADTLTAYVHGARLATKLCGLEGVRVHQRGDDEARVTFPAARLDLLEAVAEIIQARRRRTHGPERLELLRAQAAKARAALEARRGLVGASL